MAKMRHRRHSINPDLRSQINLLLRDRQPRPQQIPFLKYLKPIVIFNKNLQQLELSSWSTSINFELPPFLMFFVCITKLTQGRVSLLGRWFFFLWDLLFLVTFFHWFEINGWKYVFIVYDMIKLYSDKFYNKREVTI